MSLFRPRDKSVSSYNIAGHAYSIHTVQVGEVRLVCCLTTEFDKVNGIFQFGGHMHSAG